MATSNAFLKEIESRFWAMQRYEDVGIQNKARALIPIVSLEIRAQKRMRDIQRDIKKGVIDDVNVSIQEMLLLELLAWFKGSFFEWVDSPDCDFCDGETKFSHMSADPKLLANTDRVEMHQCTVCGKHTAFARYSDLDILLETREGRCGEWATVFTLLCLALNWHARFVCDSTDHVWTEVYSVAQRRWLHCDPCENCCDNPLIYETGWNKQLSYVIAYSTYDLQDVTWRYSANHSAALGRRNKCSEAALIQTVLKLREQRQRNFTLAQKNYLTKKLLAELVELMIEKKPTEADKQGRTSGAVDWRQQRGELLTESKTWSPSEHELAVGQMTMRYSIVNDCYENVLDNGKILGTVQKWNAGVFRATNIVRKVEPDWKMVYLCRLENSSEAAIEWKFQLKNTLKKIQRVTVKLSTKTYENGDIDIRLCDDNHQSVQMSGNGEPFSTSAFLGMDSFRIKALLTGGKGDCAFQHTQLFRESINDKNYPFSITISFK